MHNLEWLNNRQDYVLNQKLCDDVTQTVNNFINQPMNKLTLLLMLVLACEAGYSQTAAVKPDTMVIALTKNISFNWSNSQSRILRDDTFAKLKANKKAIKPELYSLIQNDSVIVMDVCFKKGVVRKGDMAFNLLDALYDVPYAAVFKRPFALIYPPCTVPDGLYDFIEENRDSIAPMLRAYYAQ